MEMSGQLHNPSVLTLEEPPVPIEYKDGWDPEPGKGVLEERKIRSPGWESNHNCCVSSPSSRHSPPFTNLNFHHSCHENSPLEPILNHCDPVRISIPSFSTRPTYIITMLVYPTPKPLMFRHLNGLDIIA
jgi:hypothetical protein